MMNLKKHLHFFRISLLTVIFACGCNSLQSGSTPKDQSPETTLTTPSNGLIDTNDRQAVVQAFNNWYNKPRIDLNFNGNLAACNAGTTSIAFQQSVIERINYYRAMVGLNSSALAPNQMGNSKAALMMDANQRLSHSPTSDWLCYSSDGATSASSSLLTFGVSGRGAIDLYIDDPGDANAVVGHRRWLLYPPQSQFSTGDTPRSNSLSVFLPAQNSTPQGLKFVAWPSAGFFPIKLFPSSNRWSFSSLGLGDAAQATVDMKNLTTGQNVPIVMEPYIGGYGSDTLVWRADSISASSVVQETTFQVIVSNINDAGVIKSYSYSVKAIHAN